MAKSKTLKLKKSLDRLQGVDYKLERQKKLQKQAEKRKRGKQAATTDAAEEVVLDGDEEVGGVGANGVVQEGEEDQTVDGAEWETDDEEDAEAGMDLSRLGDSDSDSSDDDDEEGEAELIAAARAEEVSDAEDDEDIPLSDIEDLSDSEKGDILPHQRLTINNTAALTRALKSIAVSTTAVPFSDHQALLTPAPISIPDIDDDLSRELAFYAQCLDAATRARALLKAEHAPFTRPTDYFAEMVKSDEHMDKIKKKMIDEAAGKRAAADARRQRDLKKFGKQVQVAKLQERDKAKRDMLEKVNILKRKRQGADTTQTTEEDLFDVALEDAAATEKADKAARRASGSRGGRGGERGGRPSFSDRGGRGRGRGGRGGGDGAGRGGREGGDGAGFKRQKRDDKHGFGGKKRFGKSNDAASSADASGYSVRKMKGGKRGAPRPGKSRRTARA
ncbi:eukaryotic rRNA processing protein EBP2-domain-containing protein [Cryomyces antarcticus]